MNDVKSCLQEIIDAIFGIDSEKAKVDSWQQTFDATSYETSIEFSVDKDHYRCFIAKNRSGIAGPVQHPAGPGFMQSQLHHLYQMNNRPEMINGPLPDAVRNVIYACVQALVRNGQINQYEGTTVTAILHQNIGRIVSELVQQYPTAVPIKAIEGHVIAMTSAVLPNIRDNRVVGTENALNLFTDGRSGFGRGGYSNNESQRSTEPATDQAKAAVPITQTKECIDIVNRYADVVIASKRIISTDPEAIVKQMTKQVRDRGLSTLLDVEKEAVSYAMGLYPDDRTFRQRLTRNMVIEMKSAGWPSKDIREIMPINDVELSDIVKSFSDDELRRIVNRLSAGSFTVKVMADRLGISHPKVADLLNRTGKEFLS